MDGLSIFSGGSRSDPPSRSAVAGMSPVGKVVWGGWQRASPLSPITAGENLRGTRPLTVDMETAAIAHVCYVNIIPFLAIRCITDTAKHSGVEHFEQNCKRASDIAKDITPPCSRSSADILFTHSETQTPGCGNGGLRSHTGFLSRKTASLPQCGREPCFETAALRRFRICFTWRTRWPWSPAEG